MIFVNEINVIDAFVKLMFVYQFIVVVIYSKYFFLYNFVRELLMASI